MNTEEMKEKIEENTLSQIISNYFRRIIFSEGVFKSSASRVFAETEIWI